MKSAFVTANGISVEGKFPCSLQEFLAAREIQTGIHYPAPIPLTPAFARFNRGDCPIAEKYAAQILSLPMYPTIDRSQLEYVVSILKEGLKETRNRGRVFEIDPNEMMVR